MWDIRDCPCDSQRDLCGNGEALAKNAGRHRGVKAVTERPLWFEHDDDKTTGH